MWDTWKNCKPVLQFFHVSLIREITLICCHSALCICSVKQSLPTLVLHFTTSCCLLENYSSEGATLCNVWNFKVLFGFLNDLDNNALRDRRNRYLSISLILGYFPGINTRTRAKADSKGSCNINGDHSMSWSSSVRLKLKK